ncbi:MAG: HD domain-containing protein [Agathobacter sp.]|nr:HD domain-containing protein [Agathobacter sp.]
MNLTNLERIHLNGLLEEYKRNPKVQEMKRYIQHGSISTYEHCVSVTRVSYWLNKRLHLGADEKTLVTGAFLHDFYLYDWHDTGDGSHRLHGYRHADRACDNAVKVFSVNKEIQKIIKCHMWPLNISRLPLTRAALIVCLADKYCSTIETFFMR